MTGAQPEPERAASPAPQYALEPQPQLAGPAREVPPSPPSAKAEAAVPSWLSGELARAAQEARSNRNRIFVGLALLAFAGLAVVVAGLLVREQAFWVAVSPAFAAAAMALIAFAAERLGVFAHTAELLGRRSGASGPETGALNELEREPADTRLRAQAAYEVGIDLMSDPEGSASRESLLAAQSAFAKAAADGHPEGTRQHALLILALEGTDDAHPRAFHFLEKACGRGSVEAAYNLGALYARRAPGWQPGRVWLLKDAWNGVAVSAFILGMIDASEEAVRAQQLPAPTLE